MRPVPAVPRLILRPLAAAVLAAAALLLAACTVGPDFKAPASAISTTTAYRDIQRTDLRRADAQSADVRQAKTPQAASGASSVPAPHVPESRASVDADPDPQWWRTFGDPLLDRLIERAVSGNLDLQEAVLRIAGSRVQEQQARAQGLPSVSATASYNRQQLGLEGILKSRGVYDKVGQLGSNPMLDNLAPGTGAQVQQGAQSLLGQLTQPVGLFQVGFDASWELDLFGRVRRAAEAAGARTQGAIENRNDALVSLEAEVVQTYAQLRGAQTVRRITLEQVALEQQILDLTQNRQQHGLGNQSDVESASAQLTSDQAQLPQYEQQIVRAMNALAVLTGEPPGTLDAELSTPGAVPPLPPLVPVGLPATLARRRPDIRAAEANLHAATAQIGVAIAQLYPDVSLTGQFGTRATQADYLTRWASHFYSFGPSVSLPIFQGGALVGNIRLAKAQQAEAALEYRHTVLYALQDVDNALAAYRTDQQRRAALDETAQATQRAFSLARDAYRHGIVSFINVLDAERRLSQARQQLTQATLQVTTDLAALYKALGGGWQDPAAPDAVAVTPGAKADGTKADGTPPVGTLGNAGVGGAAGARATLTPEARTGIGALRP